MFWYFIWRFSGTILLSLLSQNDSSKMAPFWHQNLLISFLICLYLIAVLIKVKVNRLWPAHNMETKKIVFGTNLLFWIGCNFFSYFVISQN
jgi:hypothetical protein